jgi:hypothetical protein
MFTTVDIYVRSVILSEPSEYHTEQRPLNTLNKLVFTRSTDSLLNKKVKFTLEQATKARKGEYSFNLRARWGGWSTPHPGRLTPGKTPVPIV